MVTTNTRHQLHKQWQFAVPDEPRDFLEAALLRQFLHGVAVIDQRVDLRHHLRDARGVHDHAFEAAMDVWIFGAHGWTRTQSSHLEKRIFLHARAFGCD